MTGLYFDSRDAKKMRRFRLGDLSLKWYIPSLNQQLVAQQIHIPPLAAWNRGSVQVEDVLLLSNYCQKRHISVPEA
jgi:hypothetical protein